MTITTDNSTLVDQVDAAWLQNKVASQKKALRHLNRRIFNQRAVLRKMGELGFILSEKDWADIRANTPALTDEEWAHYKI